MRKDLQINKMNKKSIAIFEYDWSIYHYVKDFVIKLAEAGYLVDIFLKDADFGLHFADTSEFSRFDGIRFFDFTTKETIGQALKHKYIKLLNKMAIACRVPRNYRPDQIIDRNVLSRSREIVKECHYDCMIGMEKKGLIWAGILAEADQCPIIYFSLELFIEDNPALFRSYHIRDAERKYHKLAVATIIQDKHRAAVLLKANGIEQTNILHFPVSANGGIVRV